MQHAGHLKRNIKRGILTLVSRVGEKEKARGIFATADAREASRKIV